jgi:hypothetical protein
MALPESADPLRLKFPLLVEIKTLLTPEAPGSLALWLAE